MPIIGGGGVTSSGGGGGEINYTQITAPVNVVSTTEATGTTILSPGALTFDGTAVLVQFFAMVTTPSSTGAGVTLSLFEGATQITRLAIAFAGASVGNVQNIVPVAAFYRFTPTAGSHTYTVTAYAQTTSGTPAVDAGAGGTSGNPPAFIRFTKP